MDHANRLEQQTPKLTKCHIIKNLILLSSSFFLLFTAFDGLNMLQSTMNRQGGIGVTSQAACSISFFISALLLPKYIIKKLGCKSSLLISIMCYIPYIAANFFPKWYILIPTGVLAGIGASILCGSQCTYFNESAARYSRLIADPSALSDNPSNRTSFEFVSENHLHCEMREEILKDEPTKAKSSENTILKLKCKNTDCGNVEKFVISEVVLNCVHFLKNAVEDTDLAQTKQPNESHNCSNQFNEGSPTKNLPSSPNDEKKIAYETPYILEENNKSKEEDQDDNEWLNKSYISKFDEKYLSSELHGKFQSIFQKPNTLESVTGLFFGCHGIAHYSAHICSNAISYYVLKGDGIKEKGHFFNEMGYFFKCKCGAEFCHDNKWCINDDTEYVSKSIRCLLTIICVVIASVSALLIFLFLDPLKKAKTEDEHRKISFDLILATMSHNKKKEQLFLIPISFYVGMLQGFYMADFTKSYIGCAWGASNVGLVSIFYGAACVFSSSISGLLVKYVGRKTLLLIAQAISITLVIFLMLWKPESKFPYKFFIASILFGTITGILWPQLLAFYGLLFKKDEEAAFASYFLWCSLGWTTSFLYSNHLCTYVKIYLLLSMSITGTTGYLFTERLYDVRKQEENVILS